MSNNKPGTLVIRDASDRLEVGKILIKNGYTVHVETILDGKRKVTVLVYD